MLASGLHSSKSASNIVADRWEGGELYKDVCADSAAATFVADPQDCETSTWYSAPVANIDEGESCDGILRAACTSPTFGRVPLSGDPSYKYEICTEVDMQTAYEYESDTAGAAAADFSCEAYSERQQRERRAAEVGGDVQPWSGWSGDYEYESCGESSAVSQTRVRWQAAQSACLDSGETLPCGDQAMCKRSADCVAEVQSRTLGAEDDFGVRVW